MHAESVEEQCECDSLRTASASLARGPRGDEPLQSHQHQHTPGYPDMSHLSLSETISMTSYIESQKSTDSLFSRKTLKTPPLERNRIWKQEAAKKAAKEAQREADMAEYNSFAAVGQSRLGLRTTPGSPGTSISLLEDDDAEAEALGVLVPAPKDLSDEMQALFDSHNRASVRGKLTKEEQVQVGDVQKRIKQRKDEATKLKIKAELDARRRKVLFDESSSALMQEATAAAANIKESLKQKTIASKLKEQGKTKATGKLDKSDRHGLPLPTRGDSKFISLTEEQKEEKAKVREASKKAEELRQKQQNVRANTTSPKNVSSSPMPDHGPSPVGDDERTDKDGIKLKKKQKPSSTVTGTGTGASSGTGSPQELTRTNSRSPSPSFSPSHAGCNSSFEMNDDMSVGSIHSVGSVDRALERRQIMQANDIKLKEEWAKYFGPASKTSFTAAFQRASRDLRVMQNDTDVPDECSTPRRNYLREVTKANLLPLPIVLRKEKEPKGVFLAHKGLGDDRMLPIVSVIDQLPAVESVDLCDNRLTDISLMPLMKKLVNMPTLLYLDLSFNDMDDSAVTIQAFIRAPNCALHTLLINGSDVDDYECVHLCEALVENTSITRLGLANNLIGNDEHMKVTDKNRVLGGDGIALLLSQNKTITTLDLQYNQLRLTGAVAIGKSLRENSSLKTLKLAYNSFGDVGTQWLGHSLKFNKTLEKVDLTSNSIVPKSACVLANALAHNNSLQELIIDDNILGRVGAQAVASAIQRSSQSDRLEKLIISFKSCDCFKATPSIFNPSQPGGKWILDLGEPYGAMIVEECFFLANYRAGCQINSLKYNKADVTLERKLPSTQADAFNLERFVAKSKSAASATIKGDFAGGAKDLEGVLKEFRFSMGFKQRTQVLDIVQKSWLRKGSSKERTEDLHEVFLIEVFSALFVLNDVNNDETMDVDEFLETLSSLGYPKFDRNAALTLMAEHDRDLSGTIDGSEFAMIMVKEFCRTDLPRGMYACLLMD